MFVTDERKSSLSVLGTSLLASGVLVLFAQISFVVALQICRSVGIMMVLNTANILIAYLYSMMRYRESLDVFSVAGMVVTVTCIFFVILDKYR